MGWTLSPPQATRHRLNLMGRGISDSKRRARAKAQNVAEIRALIGWLLDEGCPSVGLAGGSLGGWTAGLTACGDTRIACAVLAVPGVRTRFSPPVVWPWVRKALQALKPAHE